MEQLIDDETVESFRSVWDIPRHMDLDVLWFKAKSAETGAWESTFWLRFEESYCDDWTFNSSLCGQTCSYSGPWHVLSKGPSETVGLELRLLQTWACL